MILPTAPLPSFWIFAVVYLSLFCMSISLLRLALWVIGRMDKAR